MNNASAYDILDEFHKALRAGESPSIREHLARGAEDIQHRLLLDLIDTEIHHRVCVLREAVSMFKYRSDYSEVTVDEWSRLILDKQGYERTAFFSNGDSATPGSPNVPGYIEWTKRAEGAMGVVWTAKDENVPSVQVAFKVPSGEFLDICGRGAVVEEANKAAKVRHRNVCKVFGVDPAGSYIRMEFIEGPNLEEWGKEQRSRVEIARIVAQICHGLHAIHEAGIYHQDLKPANVMVESRESERAVIVDFGMAQLIHENRPREADRFLGTPAYMSPEQVRKAQNQPGPKVDSRADIYAVGTILYQMVESRIPYNGNKDEVFAKILEGLPSFTPKKWRGQTPGLLDICRKAISTDLADRYASALDLAGDLDRYAEGRLPKVLKAGPVLRVRHFLRRHRPQTAIALLAVILLSATAWLGLQAYDGMVKGGLKHRVEQMLNAESLTLAEMDQIEVYLAELDKLDPSTGNDLREAYIKKLIGIDPDETDIRLQPGHLEKLERVVVRLTESDPGRAISLRQSGAWESFYAVAFPYHRSTSYYAFLRPDPDRVVNLERVVTIDACLRDGNASIPAEVELFRTYFARGDAEQAEKVIKRLANRSDLSPAWRMLILRGYVWLAIWRSLPMPGPRKALVEDALDRVDAALKEDSVYRPLLVEKARLLVAKDLRADANRILDQYFDHFAAGHLSLEFAATEDLDRRLGDRPSNDNLTARFFLDACLMKGFLLEDLSNKQDEPSQQELRKYWAKQHRFVRRTHVAAYYEGAMLASLAGQLDATDVIGMVNFTAGSARTLGTSPLLNELESILRGRLLATPTSFADAANSVRRLTAAADFIATVLRNTWVSKRGYNYARQIAYRQISFAEYLNVQIRLWLFEGLMQVVGEPRNGQELITIARQELLWTAANDAFEAFAEGNLKEDKVVQLVHVGIVPEECAEWLRVAEVLPSNLRGPISYVLYRHYRDNLKRPADAQLFLETFRSEAAAAPKASPLAIVAGE